MAKQSVAKQIKMKPNARGKTSHLPLDCSCKNCNNDFYVSKPAFPAKRKCAAHFHNPPQSERQRKVTEMLKVLGLATV